MYKNTTFRRGVFVYGKSSRHDLEFQLRVTVVDRFDLQNRDGRFTVQMKAQQQTVG